MHDKRRLGNLLGATALGVGDLLLGAATGPAGVGPTGAAAVVALRYTSGLSVTELGRRIGLSQSAAARMVDGLEQRGLLLRRSTIGRSVAVHLTPRGKRVADRVLSGRENTLTDLVAVLPEDDCRALEVVLCRLLGAIDDEARNPDLVCRLCDRGACVEEDQVCPVSQAAREREARLEG